MSDMNSSNSNKNKSFYSFNLTEGRMLAVFIGIVVLLVALFFSALLLVSKMSRGKSNDIKVETTIQSDDKATADDFSDFSFYDDLAQEETVVKKDDVIEKEVAKIPDGSMSETDKVPEQVVEAESESVVKEPEIVIDNSEVLYSSKYQNSQDNTKFKKENIAKNTTTTTITQKSTTATKKSAPAVAKATTKTQQKSTTTQGTSKRYVVQIGSYTNKKIADEITAHYSKVGYPVYQQEFTKDGQKYFRLRVGPFKEKDRADNYLLSIKQSKYGKNSYISVIYI